jgi:hypothetical protein
MSRSLMRTPSPQRGEGWGEGALTERPYPLTPPSPPREEGEEHAIATLRTPRRVGVRRDQQGSKK